MAKISAQLNSNSLFMNTFSPIFTLMLLPILMTCQPAIQAGAGLSYELHFFQHENSGQFDGSIFKPEPSNLLGVNAFLQLGNYKDFQCRINLRAGEKEISLAHKSSGPQVGVFIKSYFTHQLLAADLSALALYKIASRTNYSLGPILGFFVAFNQYIDLEYVTSGGDIQQAIPELDFKVEGYPFSMYAGINLGISCQTQIRKRPIELYSLLYFSPSDLFNSDFTYQTNENQKNIKGKYQFVSFGINYIFEKK